MVIETSLSRRWTRRPDTGADGDDDGDDAITEGFEAIFGHGSIIP
jgi:hypothetical protein